MNVTGLPDWLPWWVTILIAIPLGLWVLTMLILPFNVIGVKARLEGIEARLDEIQSEIRSLVLRLPESPAERVTYRREAYDGREAAIDQTYVQPEPPRPPIPPDPRRNDFIPRVPNDPSGRLRDQEARAPRREEPLREEPRADRPAPSPRAEPRLDWRR
jgi:hypothetical protein